MNTNLGMSIPTPTISRYLRRLINQFFKILPLREDEEPSLQEYMRSLQVEIIGNISLIQEMSEDDEFVSLVSILQYLIDNECDVRTVKREVFKAIGICKSVQSRHCKEVRSE